MAVPARRIFVLARTLQYARSTMRVDYGWPDSMWDYLRDETQLRGRRDVRVFATPGAYDHPRAGVLNNALAGMRQLGEVTWLTGGDLDAYREHFEQLRGEHQPLALPPLPPGL